MCVCGAGVGGSTGGDGGVKEWGGWNDGYWEVNEGVGKERWGEWELCHLALPQPFSQG